MKFVNILLLLVVVISILSIAENNDNQDKQDKQTDNPEININSFVFTGTIITIEVKNLENNTIYSLLMFSENDVLLENWTYNTNENNFIIIHYAFNHEITVFHLKLYLNRQPIANKTVGVMLHSGLPTGIFFDLMIPIALIGVIVGIAIILIQKLFPQKITDKNECSNCEKEISNDDVYCDNCGHKIKR